MSREELGRNIKAEWEKLHGAGYDVYSGMLVYSLVMKHIAHHLSGRSSVLDLGCGNGDTLIWCKDFIKEYYGIDISSVACSSLVSKWSDKGLTHLEAKECDGVGNVPYEDNKFDAVISTLVMQHIHPVFLIRYFEEFHRVLKDGGLVVFHTTRWPGSRTNDSLIEEYLGRTASYDDFMKGMVTGGVFSHTSDFIYRVISSPQAPFELVQWTEVQDEEHLAKVGAFWNGFVVRKIAKKDT